MSPRESKAGNFGSEWVAVAAGALIGAAAGMMLAIWLDSDSLVPTSDLVLHTAAGAAFGATLGITGFWAFGQIDHS